MPGKKANLSIKWKSAEGLVCLLGACRQGSDCSPATSMHELPVLLLSSWGPQGTISLWALYTMMSYFLSCQGIDTFQIPSLQGQEANSGFSQCWFIW